MESSLLFLIRWGTYFILVGVPLVVLKFSSIASFFPYTFPKAIVFQILVEVMAAAWILLIWNNKSYRPDWRHPIVISATVFVVLLAFTQLFSINPWESFWSVQSRMTGLFHYLHIWLWFLILHSTQQTRFDWTRLVAVTTGVATLVALIGIVEWFVLGGSQVESTFGNAVHLATYLLPHVFLALWLLQSVKEKAAKQRVLVCACLIVLALLFTGSRSALLAFVLSIPFWFTMKWLRVKGVLIGTLMGVLAMLTLVFIQSGNFQHLLDTNINDRLQLWHIGWQAYREKPFVGWGLEQYSVPFNELRDPRVHTSITDLWHDRAHNIFLDMLVASGMIGMIGYILLWGASLFVAMKRKVTPLTILIFAYLVNGFFQIDTLTANIWMFLLLALLVQETRKKPTLASTVSPPAQLTLLAVTVVVFLLPSLYLFNIRPLQADVQHVRTLQTFSSNIAKTQAILESRFSKNSIYDQDMKAQLAGVVLQEMPTILSQPSGEASALLILVDRELGEALEKDPTDLKLLIALSWIEQYLVRYESDALEELDVSAQQALALAPYRPEVHELFATNAVLRGDYQTALLWYDQAQALAWNNINRGTIASAKANVLAVFGRWEEAWDELEKAASAGQRVETRFLVNVSEGIELHPEVTQEILSITIQMVNTYPTNLSVLKAAIKIFHVNQRFDDRDLVLSQLELLSSEEAQSLREEWGI